MRAVLLVAVGLLSVMSGPSLAQEASASVKETRCWVGNVTFSAGVGINAGGGVAVCNAGSGWGAGKADTPIAGCLLEGKLSSAGAIVGIRNSDTMLLQCDPSGRWVTIETAGKQ
ncbi:hypothetical protein [Devosia sp.]|uniref:hypothetical protein n=1 Tax=Devosia sp. TaxID=1871048 RepID=UPI003263E621